jgi:phage-related holin
VEEEELQDFLLLQLYKYKNMQLELPTGLFTFIKQKALVAFIPAGFFAITQNEFGMAAIFVILYILDLLFGLAKAHYIGEEISSTSLRNKGSLKFMLYAGLIMVAYCISRSDIPIIDGSLFYMLSYLSLTESLSILESLSLMGAPIPKKIINALNRKVTEETLKNKR